MLHIYKALSFNRNHLIERDMANASRNALELNEQFDEALGGLVPFATSFPRNFLGRQLEAIAETIAVRDRLFARRQVFFAAIDDFDSHSRQAQVLPNRLGIINDAVIAFHAAMGEIGQQQNVTLFTASDFGRTLAINGDGTDHGWGSHHFIVGGAVQGRRIYGEIPPFDFEHDQDAGGGRLIPTTSVEQFAEPIGEWFGLTPGEINTALPNLQRFMPERQRLRLIKA